MKNSPSSYLPPLNLLLLGVFLAVSLFGGLSQVWIQRQISQTASLIEDHEKTLQDLKRKNRFMNARIAEAQRPDELIKIVGNQMQRPDWNKIYQVERTTDADGNRVVQLVPYGKPMEVAFND